jgi:hypothetical protein
MDVTERRQMQKQTTAIENVVKALKVLTTEVSHLNQKLSIIVDAMAQNNGE